MSSIFSVSDFYIRFSPSLPFLFDFNHVCLLRLMFPIYVSSRRFTPYLYSPFHFLYAFLSIFSMLVLSPQFYPCLSSPFEFLHICLLTSIFSMSTFSLRFSPCVPLSFDFLHFCLFSSILTKSAFTLIFSMCVFSLRFSLCVFLFRFSLFLLPPFDVCLLASNFTFPSPTTFYFLLNY